MSIPSFIPRHRAVTLAATGAIVVFCGLGLAACSAPAASDGTGHSTASDGTSSGRAMLALDSAWAKSATSGMSAAFGTLTNHSDEPVTLVSAESDAAESIEFHEMAMVDGAMVMRQIQGDFEIPAGGSRELSPGGEHLMLMGLNAPLLPGDEITITLRLSNGSSFDILVPVRDTAGANEEYAPGEHDMSGEHGEMEHGSDAPTQ